VPSPAEITANQLSRLIGTPSAPVVIDVRIDEDFNHDPKSIPGSLRHPFTTIESLVGQLAGKRVIVSCQEGKKLSQGAAAILRDAGIDAEYLQGGHVGWRDAGLSLVPLTKLTNRNDSNRSLWVTRQRPKIDRIACPWLIRRFLDPNALFLYVAPTEVLAVAQRFNGFPFDVEGVNYSHRGDGCTFDTMLEEFELHTEPLIHLATIVRGADTDRHELAPPAAGLLAASLGFSRMYKDDLAQLEASIPLYDALYRWCRDATDEKHDWPMHSSKG